ncbi:MAG: methylated-DNA--[protein]-cysteine S-methyltransferase [Rikenellaceae bacterium]
MIDEVNYKRVERAIIYLTQNYKSQPSLSEVAEVVGMSKFHFQRIFTQWAGVTPKLFVEHLTVEALKGELLKTQNIIQASENVGLTAQSRAYDLMVKVEAMTPGEYKKLGDGLDITFGLALTPFGRAFIATTKRGVCAFEFIDDDFEEVLLRVKRNWDRANFVRCDDAAEDIASKIFDPHKKVSLPLLLKGTPFQINVWRALLRVPVGNVASYSQVAKLTGTQGGVRAVASAVAKNPIGYIIPCHRVIRREGVVGEYHWRGERKASIIGWEITNKREKSRNAL